MSSLSLTLPYSDLALEMVLSRGEDELAKRHQAKEKLALGTLRAGSPGCITAKGDVIGGCHRHSIARCLGYDLPADPASRRFFEAGILCEEAIERYLTAGYDGGMRREEDAAIAFKVGQDRLVTGRSDFLLLQPGSTEARTGVELKTIASYSGAARVFYEGKPDPKHLVQAALYMWQHGVPWILTYVSVAQHNVDFRDSKKYKLQGNAKLAPFRTHFYLRLVDGVLYYKDIHTGQDVPTTITTAGIRNFYELVDECIATKQLAFAPLNQWHDGSAMPWDHARYCKYCQTAEYTGGVWDDWLDELNLMKHGEGAA